VTATLDRAVDAIATALDARDLPAARTAFDKAVGGNQAAVEPLVRRLAETVALPPGMVVYGFAIDMFANPHRSGYAWRCGDCPHTAGVNYRTENGAKWSAEQHVADDHVGRPPTVVSYLDEAYWQAVEATAVS
jgi:hypothetical protein